jgi:hypothetical protein
MTKAFSYSFFQTLFDFFVSDLRKRFFTGRISDASFKVGMEFITDLSIKFYNMDEKVTMTQIEFNILQSAFDEMKESVNILKTDNDEDSALIKNTLASYEQSFNVLKNHIVID